MHSYDDGENQFSGFEITNKGVFAYEDEKYLRIRTERSRSTWSFFISIASFLGSLIAILIAIGQQTEQPKTVRANEISTKHLQNKDSLSPIKISNSQSQKDNRKVK